MCTLKYHQLRRTIIQCYSAHHELDKDPFFTCSFCHPKSTDLVFLRDGWKVHLLPWEIDSLSRTKLTTILDNCANQKIKNC